jgi:hypothetical protein
MITWCFLTYLSRNAWGASGTSVSIDNVKTVFSLKPRNGPLVETDDGYHSFSYFLHLIDIRCIIFPNLCISSYYILYIPPPLKPPQPPPSANFKRCFIWCLGASRPILLKGAPKYPPGPSKMHYICFKLK